MKKQFLALALLNVSSGFGTTRLWLTNCAKNAGQSVCVALKLNHTYSAETPLFMKRYP